MRFKLKPHLIFYIKTCYYRKVHHPVCLVEIAGRWSINWTLYFSLQSHCSIGKFYAKIKLEIGCDVIYHDCTAMRFSWKLLVPEMRINSSSPETRQFTENMSSLIAFWDNSYIWVVWRTSKCLYSTYKKNIYIFFNLGFLSRLFTNHRTAGEEARYFFNSSLPLPPASQTFRH